MKYRIFTWTDSSGMAKFFRMNNIDDVKSSRYYTINGKLIAWLKANKVHDDGTYFWVDLEMMNKVKQFLDSSDGLVSKKWRDGNGRLHIAYRPEEKELRAIEIQLAAIN